MKYIIVSIVIFYCLLNNTNAQVSFISNGQQINQAPGRNIVIGDFNNDGALDAFIVNSSDYRVYFNDGSGQFTDSGQRLTSPSGWTTPAVGDINGDGNLEVITGKTIWLNDGLGHFTAQSGMIETSEDGELSVKLADLNGDGQLDIFAIRDFAAMRVYLNDGTGRFIDSGQRLGDGAIGTGQLGHIALGDIDGNGTVDAVTTGWRWPRGSNGPCPNRIWLNDGLGNFHDSGQLLDEGDSHVHGLALGDLNNDGKPDLVMGIQDTNRSGRIYINDGSGRFTGGQNIGGASGENVALADFDKDGALDIFVSHSTPPNRVWLNNGSGIFHDSGQRLGPNNVWNWDVAAGDLNSDGKIDAFVVASQRSNVSQGAAAQVWFNTTSQTGVKDERGDLSSPDQYYLNQNYPNPFNPSTVISYRLSASSNINLSIYNILGQKIKTLVNCFQSTGEHSIIWDATDERNNPVSSGIYFYSLVANEMNLQKKMILLR